MLARRGHKRHGANVRSRQQTRRADHRRGAIRQLGGVSRDYWVQRVEQARQAAPDKPFMKLAGSIEGLPRDLSHRKGYSRS